MKRILVPLVAMAVILLLGSCKSSKYVPYFQNADTISLAASRMLYDAKIMPKDQLTITVITTDPQASAPFNLSVTNILNNIKLVTGGYEQSRSDLTGSGNSRGYSFTMNPKKFYAYGINGMLNITYRF